MYSREQEDKALNLPPKGLPSYVYVIMNAPDQAIANLTPTLVKYNGVQTDTLAEFDPTVGVYSFTPRRAGIYLIYAQITWRQSAGAGACDLCIYTGVTRLARCFNHIIANQIVTLPVAIIVPLTPADIIWCEVLQATGVGKAIYAALETSFICIKRVL